jgi:uncharacterized membrane protein (DUF4010 family)
MRAGSHLEIVRDPPAVDAAGASASGRDLGLVALLFGLAVVPVAGELAGIGRWSSGIVGFAAGAALLTGRELWAQLRAGVRARPPRT